MLLVADGELGSVKPEALLDPEKFREYFKQRGCRTRNGGMNFSTT
jgi:hypothetical protein